MRLSSQAGVGAWRALEAMSQNRIVTLGDGKPLEHLKQDSDVII